MQFGKRLVQVSILSGSIVRVWGVLESVLQRHEHMLNKSDRTMRVVRVEFPSGGRLIGKQTLKASRGSDVFMLTPIVDICKAKLNFNHLQDV